MHGLFLWAGGFVVFCSVWCVSSFLFGPDQDEIYNTAGVLRNHHNKIYAFYYSFAEFGAIYLRKECVWVLFGVIRTHVLKEIGVPVSSVMRTVMRRLEVLRTRGWVLVSAPATLCFARIWKLVADEAALKSVWQNKGAGGTQICMFCKNVCEHSVASMGDGYLVNPGEPDVSKFDLRSDADVWAAIDLLRARKPVMGKGAFESFEQSMGFAFDERGLLSDLALRDVAKPVSMTAFDPMHVSLSSGVANEEIYSVLEALRDAHKIKYADIGATFESWRLPCKAEADMRRKIRQTFVAGFEKPCRKSGSFKCEASIVLGVYELLRHYLLHVLTDEQKYRVRKAMKSYLELASFLDLYLHAKNDGGVAIAPLLQEASRRFLAARRDAYGPDAFRPKHHMMQHIAPQLVAWDGLLVDCFAHERRHKMIKEKAEPLENTSRFERTCTVRSLLNYEAELNNMDVGSGTLIGTEEKLASDNAFTVSHGVEQYGITAHSGDYLCSHGLPRQAFKVIAGAKHGEDYGVLCQELRAVDREFHGQWSSTWACDPAADIIMTDLQGLQPCPSVAAPGDPSVVTLLTRTPLV